MLLTTETATPGMERPPHADRRCVRTALRATALGIALAVTVGLTSVHTQERSREYQIKAAFLFNFIRFVEWPPAPSDLGSLHPLTVCALGPDSVGDAFAILEGQQIKGRTLAFKHLETSEEISACAAIFVERAAESQLTDLLQNTSGTPLLTVGETRDFIDAGGIIAFVYDKNELRFEIDVGAAERAGIDIRSQLLTLAANVRQAGHQP